MHVAVVSPLQLTTGNRTTALRIVGILRSLGHSTTLVDAFNARSFKSLAPPDCFVCVHAFRSAIPLREAHARTPMVLVMGGTDANDTLEEADRAGVDCAEAGAGDRARDCAALPGQQRPRGPRRLTEKGVALLSVLEKACAVVGFSTPLCDTVRAVLDAGDGYSSSAQATPASTDTAASAGVAGGLVAAALEAAAASASAAAAGGADRRGHNRPAVFEIAQGVDLHESTVSPTPFVFPDVEPGTKVVLLVANLRPVKDVLYLLDAVDKAWGEGDRYTLVLVGCVLDYTYAARVHERIQRSRGAVKMYPQQTRDVLLDMVQSADMVVNCSVSEGMCGALQEAMCVGTLVCARRNPGNEYLFRLAFGARDAERLLFDAPADFVARVHALLPHDDKPRIRQQRRQQQQQQQQPPPHQQPRGAERPAQPRGGGGGAGDNACDDDRPIVKRARVGVGATCSVAAPSRAIAGGADAVALGAPTTTVVAESSSSSSSSTTTATVAAAAAEARATRQRLVALGRACVKELSAAERRKWGELTRGAMLPAVARAAAARLAAH